MDKKAPKRTILKVYSVQLSKSAPTANGRYYQNKSKKNYLISMKQETLIFILHIATELCVMQRAVTFNVTCILKPFVFLVLLPPSPVLLQMIKTDHPLFLSIISTLSLPPSTPFTLTLDTFFLIPPVLI